MREIKFRAWDKINKRMIQIVGFVKHYNEIRIWYINPEKHRMYNESFSDRNIEIMQYTGLRDKNGKEIYEGDILQVSPKNKILMSVEWHQSGVQFKLRYLEDDQWIPCFMAKVSKFEIIGNIYENKDLLTK